MGLNETASAERIHIGFFGRRNAGKSSLVNAITGQELSVVSRVKGTTTDPVQKAMELLPLGPVVIIDTPGLDDEGELGLKRVQKAKKVLTKTDIAVLVVDGAAGMHSLDEALLNILRQRKIPHLVVYNKADLVTIPAEVPENTLYVSSLTGYHIWELKEQLAAFAHTLKTEKVPVSDLLQPGDVVVLVTPIDESAPKGRLILPQQLVLRDLLDHHCIPILCQPEELPDTIRHLGANIRLVITDSQVFGAVSKVIPDTIPLTSFSILMARYKGDLKTLVAGAARLGTLTEGDSVLVCEGCTHHRQCNDIGTVKIPRWLEGFSNSKLRFTFVSGGDFPEDLSGYSLIVHCGGCMLNETQMKHRIHQASDADVPIVNYGIAIAHIHGILKRSLQPFPEILALLQT